MIVGTAINPFILTDEIWGCTDSSACNYNVEATLDDDSCEFTQENYDCDGNCSVGEDCLGECGGLAVVDECGICDNDASNDCSQDCADEWGGVAFLDECTVPICSGGTTGLVANAYCTDCNGSINGIAFIDGCDNCVGGTTELEACLTDCMNVDGGNAYFDDCGVCVETPNENCIEGCDGLWENDGTHSVDDECEVCNGDDTTCTDCAGDINGSAYADPNCFTSSPGDICVGGTTDLNACVQDCAGAWGGSASNDECEGCKRNILY